MNPLLICLFTTGLIGQANPIEATEARKAALDGFLKDAQTYEMRLEADTPKRLELLPNSILNWGSAERNGEDGGIFVWMNDGRPEVVGAIWSLYRKSTQQTVWRHGLQSLCERPVTATFESKLIWSPKTPGVQFKALNEAEAPAANSAARLAQMRNLAREFTVELDEQSGGTTPLRLLTQPILRYEPRDGIAREGAIFAFSAGNDPDALLLVEARDAEHGPRWEFAFGRLHFVEIRAFRRGEQVWKVERDRENPQHQFGAGPGREKIYYSVVRPR